MKFEHGTPGGYTNHKCRCDLCKKANSDSCRIYRNKNIESVNAQRLEYRKANRRKLADNSRKYYENNIEARRNYDKRRYAENPDRKYSLFIKTLKRRMFEKNTFHGCISKISIQDLIILNNNCCVYCGGPYEHIDHIVPLSGGGLNCIKNLAPACAKCNMSKGSKPLEYWLTDTVDIKTLNCQLGDS